MTLDEAFEKAERAMAEQRGRYFWEPIPVPLDSAMYDLVSAFAQADARSQSRLLERLTKGQRDLISSFSIRLASMAVRERDPDLVVLGLVAQWLGWPAVEDPRERVMDQAPLYHAAVKLEANPAELVDRAAAITRDEDFRTQLRVFVSRPEETKTLKLLGYREVMGPDGFRFEPGGSGW
jgi:hypothetical protein